MAVVSTRQSPSYALIVFIVLWVIATMCAIHFYAQRGDYAQNAEVARLREELEHQRRQQAVEVEKLKSEIATRDSRIMVLNKLIASLRPSPSGMSVVANGSVIGPAPGTREVYINLGRMDRIVPGMTFSVHDPRIGVQVQEGKAAGKGGIAVVQVGEGESLCRVTRLEDGQKITANDLIFNPVYSTDKNRMYHWVVYGDFDLDADGRFTVQERDTVARLIKDAGGIVDEPTVTEENGWRKASISPQTDYLVLGARPQAPKGIQRVDLVDVDKARLEDVARRQQDYDAIESSARKGSVPILCINQFLQSTGHYVTPER